MAALSCDISVVKEGCSELGEGPHWDEKTQRIIWVDILGHSVHLLDPVTGKVRFNLLVDSENVNGIRDLTQLRDAGFAKIWVRMRD